jgi:hypothetical protein
MKNKYQTGLVIYRKEKEEIVRKIIDEVLSLYRLRNNQWLGHTGSVGVSIGLPETTKFVAFQIRKECFFNYSDFDGFLIELGQILDDIDNLGMVIGHIDKTGFVWLDYNGFDFPRKEMVNIRKKYLNDL